MDAITRPGRAPAKYAAPDDLPLFSAAEESAPMPAPYVAGSATSEAAAAQIRPKAVTLRAQVFLAIGAAGAVGVTADELERDLGMKGSTLRPRIVELRDGMGLIEVAAHKRPTASGRTADVYVLTDMGRRDYVSVRDEMQRRRTA